MNFFHVDSSLTAYLHGELTSAERERIERHLARCGRCRDAVAHLRAVHSALPALPLHPAPDTLWQRIETELDAAGNQHSTPSPKLQPAGPHRGMPQTNSHLPQTQAQAAPAITPDRTNRERFSSVLSAFSMVKKCLPARTRRWQAASLACLAIAGIAGIGTWVTLRQRAPSWEVRTLQGRPAIGWFAFGDRGKLRVGESLTTDSRSRAEITVADIGAVRIAPGSRVRLEATGRTQHRLELEQGALEAKVVAPPRLFVVDTRAGRAVDLGCAYRLETNGGQSTLLRVTRGEVALEDGGRSSLVPQGFTCESRRLGGLGTPMSDSAAIPFRQAVQRFDFDSGGDAAVEAARAAAKPADVLTLWHLLRRVSPEERGRLFGTMARLSRPPQSVTRAGVMGCDARMLENWKEAILYDLSESAITP